MTKSVRKKRILVLLTDAFGGHGGIALYNRDLLSALCARADCAEVVAIPRLMPRDPEPMPERLTYVTAGIDSKLKYLAAVLKAARGGRFDLIVCGHINLLPIAHLLRACLRVPLILGIYGIDAWQPTGSPLINRLARKIDAFFSISDLTGQRFLAWSGVSPEKGSLLPNAIHAEKYGPGPKDQELLDRYKLKGKTVLMTLGRLDAQERYKGFDEIMAILPDLAGEFPDIAYLIVGDGSDRGRLEQKAMDLGLGCRVVFAGYVAEREKAAHYRLADLYVMPSRGEGFGFVFLEAMACGVPVIGSKLDGSREALLDGELGLLVDPDNPAELIAAVLTAFKTGKRGVPEGLDHFSFTNFARKLDAIIDPLFAPATVGRHGEEKSGSGMRGA